MQTRTRLFGAVLMITILAGSVRFYAARNLYGDDDEGVYMKRAVDYSNFIRSGKYDLIASYDLNYEHPSLYKILYGVALLIRRPLDKFHLNQVPSDQPVVSSEAATWIMAARYVSVAFGTLAASALAIVNPWAGLFLGVHTLSVKYTSEVYLEAFPMFTSLLCAISYLHWFNNVSRDSAWRDKINLWLAVSALFLGLTAASKYIYCVVAIAIALHFVLAIIQRQIPTRFLAYMIAWCTLALGVFFFFNPYLWPDPINRLSQSIQYNFDYSHSEHVIQSRSEYPFWQPFRWLFSFSSFYNLGPPSAFIFDVDTPIFILAMIGLPRLITKKRFYFYWLFIALIFLLAWNTKWPQYALVVLLPMSVSASEGLITAWSLGRKLLMSPEGSHEQEQVPPKSP
jgi:hypothetical protein